MQTESILAVIINWNGWRDTVVCLQSLLNLEGPAVEVVVCDNGSTDGSVERLREWSLQALGPAVESSVDLPSGGRLITIEGGRVDYGLTFVRLRLLQLDHNLGYAGAINRGMAWGRQALDPGYYWLLNNDLAFESGALDHMLQALLARPDIGMCGSVLREWNPPHEIQAVGGRFNRWLAVGQHLKDVPVPRAGGQDVLEVDYPVGASMLVTRGFVEKVGVMSEAYFLYYEEVDWARRARAGGFRPAVALRSRLRHKEGASTGSVGGNRHKSMLSEYYGVVNRLRFTRKFSPLLLPIVWLSLALVVLERAVHLEWARAGLVLRLMFAPHSVERP